MISNSELKEISSLRNRKGRAEQGKFLIEGKRSIIEAISSKADLNLIAANASVDPSKFFQVYSLAAKGVRVEKISAMKFAKLSSTENSQGIIAVAKIHELAINDVESQLCTKEKSIVLILDRISDPGNLGTILRSAEWFGVDIVVVAEESVDIYYPKVVRSAMAAIAGMKILREADIEEVISVLKGHGFAVVGASQVGNINYMNYEFPQKIGLVFGSEASGIATNILSVCETTLAIPRFGKMESLNVGVAASIILAEAIRQRSKGMFRT